MRATLSFLGMVNQVPSLISAETFPLPEGLSHEVLDPILLAETAELEVLYPEPNTLGIVIAAWATARNPAWTRMAAALAATYNPIHNYDRTESSTEELEGSASKAGTNDRTGSSDTAGTSSGSESASLNKNVHGYNSAAANVPSSADSSSGQSSGSTSSSTDTTQADEWSEDSSNEHTITRTGHVSGNIGVTTSQQMIQAELELRKIDVYKVIVQEFKSMFCIGVY